MLTSISADELFQVIASKERSNGSKLEFISQLKTHVKKDFVDLKQVPRFIEALSIAVDIPDLGILGNAFSVLSHLIKRVSMQDKSGALLKSQSYLVLPIIISRLGDPKPTKRNSARKALEAYYFSSPEEVEDSITEIALKSRNSTIIIETVSWMDYIVHNVNQFFKLNPFLPHLINLLSLHLNNEEIVGSIENLLISFYTLKHNRLYKFDLARELELKNVPLFINDSIMDRLTIQTEPKSEFFVQAGHERVTLDLNHERVTLDLDHERVTLNLDHDKLTSDEVFQTTPHSHRDSFQDPPKSNQGYHAVSLSRSEISQAPQISKPTIKNIPSSPQGRNQSSPLSSHKTDEDLGLDLDVELQAILSKNNYALDASVPATDFPKGDELYNVLNDLMPCFEDKETEFNWGRREKSIIKLRSISRGNAPLQYRSDYVACIKEIAEGICKAISSLRTTLSSHGCQLVKEICIALGSGVDSLVELFIGALLKLCSATKNIASKNANMAICAIFANASYNYRSLQKVQVASQEKNFQPRSYCGIWLQIALLRFHDTHSFLASHGSPSVSGTEFASKILIKILSDPNPTVRQVAKDTFWCFWSKFPSDADTLLSKLESNVVKALERSKPSAVSFPTKNTLIVKKVRPTLKESIMEKNKEIRRRQRETNSRPASRAATDPIPQTKHKTELSSLNRVPSARRTTSNHSTGRQVPTNKEHQHSLSLEIRNSEKNLRKYSSQRSRSNTLEAVPPSVEVPKSLIEKVALFEMQQHPLSSISHDGEAKEQETSDYEMQTEQPIASSQPDMVFDKQSDPILKFLSSNQTDLIVEGINLLKYAIMCEEDLSSEVRTLLKQVSIREPTLLKPLILSSESLFKKTRQFFAAEDFIRVCAILILPIDEIHVDLIISMIDVDQIYDSITRLLSYTISTSNIIDDDDLTMQIIRYKSAILVMIVDFLEIGLDKIPITDSYFLKLTANLFELVNLLRSTSVYSSFSNLMSKLYKINPNLFLSELELVDQSTKEEVDFVVGIDYTLDLGKNSNSISSQLGPLFDLTKVVHEDNALEFSPVKLTTDFTMIVPVLKDNNELTYFSLKEMKEGLDTPKAHRSPDLKVVDLEMKEGLETPKLLKSPHLKVEDLDLEPVFDKVDDNIDEGDAMEVEPTLKTNPFTANLHQDNNPVKESTSDIEVDVKEVELGEESEINKSRNNSFTNDESYPPGQTNIFVETDTSGRRSGLFKINENDRSTELAKDFAQVKITELSHSLEGRDHIQSLIERVDPLKSISNRNKAISIFEDPNGSPQKVREYKYSDLNWFNFQLAKTDEGYDELSIDKFKSLCSKLGKQNLESKEFVTTLNYLQSIEVSSLEFQNYFHSEGVSLLESSLWDFLTDPQKLSPGNVLSAIVLLKQSLINGTKLKLKSLWKSLLDLSSLPATVELSLAIGETFDEMQSGLYPSTELMHLVLYSLQTQSTPVQFLLECLLKLLESSISTNDSMITEIDTLLSKYINNNKVEIRRLVIVIYGKLLKTSRIADTNKVDRSHKNLMNGILQRVSIPQKKLIEHYSQ